MGGSDLLDEPHPLKLSPNPPEIDRWVQEWPRSSQGPNLALWQSLVRGHLISNQLAFAILSFSILTHPSWPLPERRDP